MKLLTVREAAKQLGISTGLVYGLCACKRLRHERYGLGRGVIRIPEDALDEFRESVTIGNPDLDAPAKKATPMKLKHLTL